MVTEADVLAALSRVRDPELGRDVVSLGMIKDLKIDGSNISFTLELTTPACPYNDQIEAEVRRVANSIIGVSRSDIKVSARVLSARVGGPQDLLPGVKNVIAVASGKGGVGKSTVTVNLALALAKMGATVGILDADIYGPNIPRMLRIQEKPTYRGGRVVPAIADGIRIMSLGLFVLDSTAMIWRGPMVAQAVSQLLGEADWGELDYIVVDLPPGTGDASLTLAQTIPLTGVVIVTTPQDAAIGIATKALQMFRQLNVNIIGVIENMSYYICPDCGHRDEIFGHGGAKAAATELGAPFLGEIPLDPLIRIQCDLGRPIVAAAKGSPSADAYVKLAKAVAARISVLAYEQSQRPEVPGAAGKPEKKPFWTPKL